MNAPNSDKPANSYENDARLDWALDVSLYPTLLAWVPCDLERGEFVFNLTVIADKPPGRAVALCSPFGQDVVDKADLKHGTELRELFEKVNAGEK